MPASLGYRLRFWRLARQCNQRELARAIGMSQSFVCFVEQDKYTLNDIQRAKAARRLGIPPEYLSEDGPTPLAMLHTNGHMTGTNGTR